MGREGPPRLLYLPPGFRFNPTDEELVVEYLRKKSAAQSFVVPMIAEVDIYRFDPWNLPEKALFGDKMCYFFSHRDRKYPNGSRPNRAAGSGYWKATGTDKPIYSHAGSHKQLVGVKKSLVFFIGKTPKGTKTNWIMHEYRLADAASRAAKRKGNLRLDGWVLCGIYKKPMGAQKAAAAAARKECNEKSSCNLHEVLAFLPDIDNTKLLSLPPLSSLNIFKEQNCCKYMEVTDFADNVSRSCAGMPWRNIDNTNKNSVPSLMDLGQKADQQYSNRGAGVLTEVAPYKCKYSCPIDGLHEYNSPTRNGNINNDLAPALPMPESPPLMNHHDSPDEEIQGTFRLHDEMDQLHPSQQLAFEYNNQVQTTFNASHMDPMNMVFEPVCLESLQSSHPV